MQAQDSAEVFDDDEAVLAELEQDAAGRIFRAILSGCAGEQRCDGECADDADSLEPVEQEQELRFAATRARDDDDPDRVAFGDAVRDGRGEHDMHGRRVGHVQVPLEGGDNLVESFYDGGNPVEDDLLTGVRFARNRVHHQWAKALNRHENPRMPLVTLASTSSRLVGPRPGFWWYWVKASELPPGKPDAAAEEQYTTHLAGRSAEATLEALRPVLQGLV